MINSKYVLFSEIFLLRDKSERLYCDALWAKDLKLHTDYLSQFSLCCPIVEIEDPSNIKELEKHFPYNFAGVQDITSLNIQHIYETKHSGGWASVFFNIIPNLIRVAKACKNTEIAHSSGAGWPFPLSYYLLLLKPFYTFQWVMVIESTFFLVTKEEKFNLRRFVGHYFHSAALYACVNTADARIFVQEHYKKLFLKNDENALVAAATWLDGDQFLTEAQVKEKSTKRSGSAVKLILAGRLLKTKGILILFDAIKDLEQNGVNVQIDVIGSGDLEKECREFIKQPRSNVKMAFLESVPYGAPFFKCLSQYDVLLLPSLSNEQPRIIFDAFSQGLCVIGSDTTGIMGTCQHNENAILFETGNPKALTEAITNLVSKPKKIEKLALHGLKFAQTRTHQQVHHDREIFLSSALDLK